MAKEDIVKFLKENPSSDEFAPYVYHSKDADALTVYLKGDADYSKRLTDHVTLFLSIDTNEIVGCRIKGIADILVDLPNYICINHDDVELSLLFLSFRGSAETEDVREALNTLAREAGGLKLQPSPSDKST